MGKNDYLPLATDAAGAAATNAAASERRELNWKLKLAIPAVVLFALVSALGTGVFNCGGGKGGMKHGMGMNGTMGMHSGMPMHGMEGNMGTSAVAALRAAACPAQPASRIIGDDWDPASDEEYASRAAERLSASVQIQTVSYDDLPLNGSDARFDPHYKFAEWLEATYPVVYDALSHEAVNVHAHLYTWKGSSEGKEKKPILLMAHEDTVPVNPDTEGQWTFPPWSGEVTRDATPQTPGTWVWGRGASDCKNSLTGILGAVEKLVEEGYTPERDVLIAFGYDEEVSDGSSPRGSVC
jgi:Gly-Xaa carboxypeptidase